MGVSEDVPWRQVELLSHHCLSLLWHSLLMQPAVHTPSLLPLRAIPRVVVIIIEEPLVFNNLSGVIIYCRLVDFLATKLGGYWIFPLLVSLSAWELESGGPSCVKRVRMTCITYKTLIDCRWEFAIACLPLGLIGALSHQILVVWVV